MKLVLMPHISLESNAKTVTVLVLSVQKVQQLAPLVLLAKNFIMELVSLAVLLELLLKWMEFAMIVMIVVMSALVL